MFMFTTLKKAFNLNGTYLRSFWLDGLCLNAEFDDFAFFSSDWL